MMYNDIDAYWIGLFSTKKLELYSKYMQTYKIW
jgi:hypothetical protein